ncbi:glycosyl transferase [Hymenobacter taeanensis]|uniref:Peptide O-xylosyltransferase n=1 Tax=Hymenobacter taeanensis TaxID=2735321 RepID=A0A6M6BEM4_9BACT|nr:MULTISPECIES: beta-1,6-N-acetylglucosaminyltransferase [Hymenobacter]QJX47021.1 glycosyl transferase [Hymenobacter taeanensis]UOQ80899.1 beta-1,6-N-acetylglucosaminyltransferase [Hymenobacter sp. 5414T-23]
MRIAHLITAHANPSQLQRLIESLQHPDADFYLCIDGKVSLEQFLPLTRLPRVTLISQRIPIHWGTYSIVQSTLLGVREILLTRQPYDYINLLSGSDYPLKPTASIHEYLAAHPRTAFINHRAIYTHWPAAVYRIDHYDLGHYAIPYRETFQALINRALPKRTLPNKLEPYGGSAWFTIPPFCAQYVLEYLDKHPSVHRFFKFTWGADEVLFQTILANSPFRESMNTSDLRYIDWSEDGPSPKVLTLDDALALQTTEAFWARKFLPGTPVLDYLDELRQGK